MVNQASLRAAAVFVLFFLVFPAVAQNVEVSIDRDEIARGETLTYTIRVFEQRQGMQLDLTPLTENFDVLGTRTSSQIRSINGSVESWTDYIVTLFPLTEGDLEIPPLTINNSRTDPITVKVVNQGARSNQSSEELFLEIEVNKDSIYVQEQLLFTVRLFYTINGIRNPQFTELEMPDAVIQLIGSPNQYEKLIDGVRYGVYEKRYVIFPQRSGPLEIPDILFRGEVTDGSSNFVFRNLNTRRVTAFIDGMTVDVKQRPAAAANSPFWLPVSGLTLEDNWAPDTKELQIGDSVARTITMVADGLDGAMLPPFEAADLNGANTYPDPAEIDRTFVSGAIVGTRVETMTIVPTIDGKLEIPEIAIPWWNIDTDQPQVTNIPAKTLNVGALAGAAPAEQAVSSSGNLEELLAMPPVVDQEMIDEQAEAEYIEIEANWLRYLISAAFLIVLVSIYRLVIWPNQQLLNHFLSFVKNRITERYSPANNERVAFRQLLKTLKRKEVRLIRTHLVAWCDHFITSRRITNMEDILQVQEAAELHEHVKDLQTDLFRKSVDSEGQRFDPARCIRTIRTLRSAKIKQSKQQANEDRYSLPPLYPT
ncbi:MAG: BatD family protein [Pseudomonadota bacterium]|nr:BatD family protein [Pseudomonadota bacterium]